MRERAKVAAKKTDAKREYLPSEVRNADFSRITNSPVGQGVFLQRTIGNQAVPRLIKSGAIWAKNQMGQPNDICEQEADKVAGQVMCRPGLLFPAEDAVVEQTQFIAVPPIVHEVLRSPGQPLGLGTRLFMESQFGHDFSKVRVHTDETAADSAFAVGARAYTVGRNIVFARGQFEPDHDGGSRLLAHELVHVIQQGQDNGEASFINGLRIGKQKSPSELAAEEIADRVNGSTPILRAYLNSYPLARNPGVELQRRVSLDMDEIRKDLSTSFWGGDWAVTDEEAHDALMRLKQLNDQNLEDTVAVMEAEGLVDILYDNVSDEDQAKEEEVLQRIQNCRVHKVTIGEGEATLTADIVGSCSIDQQFTIDSKIEDTKEHAKESKEAIDDFCTEPKKQPQVKDLLDRHFLHMAHGGKLTEAQQLSHAQDIRSNFEKVENQANPFTNICASPFDQLCRTMAGAYVNHQKRTVMFCPSFFKGSESWQTHALFHEFVHVYAGVADRGYGDERIFAYLSPDAAKNNADSYALFAVDVMKVPGGSQEMKLRYTPQDQYVDCTDAQADEIRRTFAFASRMITNALNNIADADMTSRGIGQTRVENHFKTSDRGKLQRVVDRFKKIYDKLKQTVNFECEESCEAGTFAYYYSITGTTSHICPEFFAISSPQEKEDKLLLIVIMERLGLTEKGIPGSDAYRHETIDDSYENPYSYAAYAREVS